MSDKLPRMDYRQHRRARRLVHECCNYDEGNCLLLDDGEPCVCVQSISLSLMCRWFRVAVLPLDGELAAALLYRGVFAVDALMMRQNGDELHAALAQHIDIR